MDQNFETVDTCTPQAREQVDTMQNEESCLSQETHGNDQGPETTDSAQNFRAPRSERKRQMHMTMLEERKASRQLKKMRRRENTKEGQGQLPPPVSEVKEVKEVTEVTNEMVIELVLRSFKTDQEKPKTDPDRPTKREMKALIHKRLTKALETGQRICVDLSMENTMTLKEKGKLAQQICRLYGANRKSEEPAHVYLTGINKSGELYTECVRKNDGFENYLLEMTEKKHTEMFDPGEIVYLTPDAETPLTEISPSKVYVMGGLVDESITKNLSLTEASAAGITTARLPIAEHMVKDKTATYFSQVLAINQVFEILLTFMKTGDWNKALTAGIPKRNGYILKDESMLPLFLRKY